MAFKMRSGNKVSFKNMGSSPMKQSINPDDLNMEKERIKKKVKEGYDNPADTPSNVEIPKSETYTPPEKEKARVMTKKELKEAAKKDEKKKKEVKGKNQDVKQDKPEDEKGVLQKRIEQTARENREKALNLDNDGITNDGITSDGSESTEPTTTTASTTTNEKTQAELDAEQKRKDAIATKKRNEEKRKLKKQNTSERNTSKKNTRTTPTDEVSTDDRTGRVKTKQEIKQDYKTQKLIDRGADTKGGGRRTKQERLDAKRSKLNAQQRRARQFEDVGRGEKTFGWKNFGKSMLEGRGLRGSISDGIGTGESKSKQIQRRSDKLEGKQDRVDERRSQGKTTFREKVNNYLKKQRKTKKKNK